jgi:PepSY-associated TM region
VIWFRKWLILTHRYLGIGLSLLFVMWFISGIGMIYAGGMPQLTQRARREHMPALDVAKIRLSPAQAAQRIGATQGGGRVLLQTIMDRPVYRFGRTTVFADTGELLGDGGPSQAITIAARFMNLPERALHHDRVLTEADQWTIGQRRQLPLYKVRADDGAHTELYVSTASSEVVLATTRGSRALAWVAAIPHWMYFAPLRLHDSLWRTVVLWTSALGAISAVIGLVLAVIQFAPRRPFRLARVSSYIPYAGWMRWHYITGVIFGIFTLTWVFSGLLSMEPLEWASTEIPGADIQQALSGGTISLSAFPAGNPTAWNQVLAGHMVKQVEFRRIQGDHYYVLQGDDPTPLLVAADSLQVRHEPFATDSLLSRVKEGYADAPILESTLLSDYDAYYYARDDEPRLPVLRVKFDDEGGNWLYVDAGMSQLVAAFSRRARLERWIYHGFHSLDFSFWYYNRPLWDIGVIGLSLGGAALSAIGVFIGFRRVKRSVRRPTRARTTSSVNEMGMQ